MAASVGDPKYDVGSTVYVPYEGGTHYEARVIKKEVREHTIHDGTKAPMWFYLVHYMGWNKKYDEWVEEIGCASDNPEKLIVPNRTKQKGAGAGHGGNVKYDYAKPQISIAIPGVLKQQLIRDHDCIKENKNIPMPRKICIIDILQQYTDNARLQSASLTIDVEEQVAHGIRNYFDRTLALLLLYNEERAQADEQLKNNDSPSSIYGADHLLRLFLKLPELLPIESSTEDQYRLLQAKLHELLEFLAAHKDDYFAKPEEYVAVSTPSTQAGVHPIHAPAAQQLSAAPPKLSTQPPVQAPGAEGLGQQPPQMTAPLQQPEPMQH